MPELDHHIRPYLNGRDVTQRSRGALVIDLFGVTEAQLRAKFSDVWQHLHAHVFPQRSAISDRNADSAQYARDWWLHGKTRPDLRRALSGLRRYIATVETAKHRIFTFLPAEVLPDNKLIVIAADDAFVLGVLSSCHHIAWVLAQGNWLGVGNDPVYAKTQAFDPYPFPAATPSQREAISAIAEELDAHRRARLAAHPHLTLTGLYNVLAAIRAGTLLTPAERDVHDAGQVSILRSLHDRLDSEVAAAYGWPADLPDAEIVVRVLALNAERAAEEAEGRVRWLRPEFQAPLATVARQVQVEMDVGEGVAGVLRPWPKDAPAQFVELRSALAGRAISPPHLARLFKGAKAPKVREMVETLVALGQARPVGGGRYVA